MPPRYLLLALLLATLLALILFPPPAHAGTYDVYSCRLPDGSPAPTDGWTPFATREPEVDVAAEAVDRCASGEALIARLGFGFWRLGATAGWSFNAPRDTPIVALAVYRSARSLGPGPNGNRPDLGIAGRRPGRVGGRVRRQRVRDAGREVREPRVGGRGQC
jgi:hypothetical protein